MIQLVMFVMGLVALFKGEIKLTKKLVVQGRPARIVGLILAGLLPAAFAIGICAAIVMVQMGLNPADYTGRMMILDLCLTAAAGIAAVIVAKKYGGDPATAVASNDGESLEPKFAPPKDPSNPFNAPRT